MAYIPDVAIDRFTELSKGARLLYVFLARCRNHKTGRCFPGMTMTQQALDVTRCTVFALRKELAEKGWATFDGDEAKNLLGFNSLINQTVDVENKEVASLSFESMKNQTVDVENKEVTENQSEKSDSTVGKIRLKSLINQTKKSEKSYSLLMNNQQREPAKGTKGEERTPSAPSAPDLDALAEAVSTVTGIRPSGWRIEGEIRTAAIELHGQGFDAAQVIALARKTGKIYKVKFCAADLASDRARLANVGNSNHDQSRAAHRQQALEIARQKLFGGGNDRK